MCASFKALSRWPSSPLQRRVLCQSFEKRCLAAYDREQKGPKQRRRIPQRPQFTPAVEKCLPTAVGRSEERPQPDPWETVEPRHHRNQIVTLENGERRVERNGRRLPLYRDWEKEFGKPIGDSRPYYRQHMGPLLMPYNPEPSLPSIPSLVVVEGLSDWMAVKSAVNAHVFVCDGTLILHHIYHAYTKRTVGLYQGDVILLMDPDTAGRRLRTACDDLMKPCKHAFVSEYDAVVGMGQAWESVGIANASPAVVRAALAEPKGFDREAEPTFGFETLYEMGLVQTPDERIEGVRLRRRFACGLLGIGFCDCRQLLKQLNGYQFSLAEVQAAAETASLLVEEWKARPWQLQTDYSNRAAPRKKRRSAFSIPSNFVSAF